MSQKLTHQDVAISALRVAYEKAVGLGNRLNVVCTMLRIGLFFSDGDLVRRNLEKAHALMEEGGDWDRRNKLKIYEGIYQITIRNFAGASEKFLSSLATFTCTELIEYKEFVRYAVLASLVSLSRSELKTKVVEAPEVLEVIHDMPNLQSLLNSLVQCNYKSFFTSLAAMEGELKRDRYAYAHTRYFVKEMRRLAYVQLLESYRSLTLESMAKSFGVSEEFIDRDLSKFIVTNGINCVIDKVGGVVETNRPDWKNAQYQDCIKQGDSLLNRLQQLSRVITI